MNWDQIAGSWKQFTGRIQQKWGQLTHDEVDEAKGDRERLEGIIQKKYGVTKEEARAQIDEWMAKQ
ncbi:CsbD family protein [Palleronia sp. LCG004]|uniref:CsbD family protein n=1 Tax=Palleronia sp. LCG004 TaxID=3079304 RepID=UPI0029436232|nr:CsbD family protein [Palleronia sp. LCG004]WOI56466.1 CsbD family protein [Palleronia sp. LCG004]